MANKVLVTRNKLDLLADSISAKSGEALPLTIGEMKIAVDGIVLNSYTIGDGNLDVDENDYLYFDDDGTGIIPTGTISISANGTYDVTQYASAEVNISGSTVQTQTKTATPTESQQTISPDSGYLLSSVTVNAISSTYVGSGITQRSSTDLTASGATITVPDGYYSESVSKSVASGTAGTPSASKGTVSNHQISITPSVTNTTGYITGGTKNGTAVTVTASELASGNKEITANGTGIDVVGYSTVNVAVPADEPNLQAKTNITPTESSQTIQPDTGYDGLSSVQINAISSTYVGSGVPKISESNFGMSMDEVELYASQYPIVIDEYTTFWVPRGSNEVSATINTSTGLITASSTLSYREGYDYGSMVEGTTTDTLQLTTQAAKTVTPTESEQTAVAANVYTTGIVKVGAISSTYVGSGITQRDDTDLTVSGATVTVPSGYYADNETKTVASGSASTPATTITANPSITVSSSGLITATTSANQSVTPTVSAGYVSSGTAGTITVSGSNTQQLTTQGATTITPTKSSQTAVASGVYTTGTITVAAIPSNYITTTDATASASDILSGETAYVNGSKVTGTLTFSTITISSSDPSGGNSGDIWIKSN